MQITGPFEYMVASMNRNMFHTEIKISISTETKEIKATSQSNQNVEMSIKNRFFKMSHMVGITISVI